MDWYMYNKVDTSIRKLEGSPTETQLSNSRHQESYIVEALL
jgi:hypothetical protein